MKLTKQFTLDAATVTIIVEDATVRVDDRDRCGMLRDLLKDIGGDLPPNDAPKPEWYDVPIMEMRLGVRAVKCLIRMGVETVGDLCQKTADDLLECKGFGVTCLNEVRERLTELEGAYLRGDEPPNTISIRRAPEGMAVAIE